MVPPRGHHRINTGRQAPVRDLPPDFVVPAALVLEALEDKPTV